MRIVEQFDSKREANAQESGEVFKELFRFVIETRGHEMGIKGLSGVKLGHGNNIGQATFLGINDRYSLVNAFDFFFQRSNAGNNLFRGIMVRLVLQAKVAHLFLEVAECRHHMNAFA